MDINDVRTIITVVSFATFIGIVLWAWSSRQRDGFNEAARQPLLDDDSPAAVPVEAPASKTRRSLFSIRGRA